LKCQEANGANGSGSDPRKWPQAGAQRGYEYILITDHSKGLKIAGGTSTEAQASPPTPGN